MITLYGDWQANTVVICATTLAVSLAVLVHYEGLALISNWLTKRRELHSRRKALYSIFFSASPSCHRNLDFRGSCMAFNHVSRDWICCGC